MPQVDLETLMSACSGGSDRKIACETAAPPPNDYPPESFWLSKDAEIDWFDHSAFYERNESMKGNSIQSSGPNSSSQRFSVTVKSKPSIIGLPKTQKTNYVDKNRKKGSRPGNVRLFPKRTGSVNKSVAQLAEPSSPNVSCMGRVKSKRKNRKKVEPGQNRPGGFCKQFLSMFRSDRRSKPVLVENEPERERLSAGSRIRKREPVRKGEISVEPEPPGLGGMKRFASGRRSSSSADLAE